MRNRAYIWLILGLATITACQEEIQLDLPPNEAELVVEGYLVDLDFYIPETDLNCSDVAIIPKWQIELAAYAAAQFPIDSIEKIADYFPFNKIRLTTTSDYFSSNPAPSVSNATVRLYENGILVETLLEDPIERGSYRITHDPDSSGKSAYHLEIEALGNFYATEPEPYIPTPPLLEVTATYRPNFIGDTCAFYMGINTYETPGPGDNYRWMFYLNSKYKAEPWYISAVDDANFDGLCLFGLDLYGDELELGDTLIVFQLRTNEHYTSFINSLQNQTAFVGGPFDTPPAPIKGNVRNISTGKAAFGYFSAGGVSANLVIVPDEIPDEDCP